MSARFDAVVIGGNVNGLVAVSLLARAGLRAVLVERSPNLTASGSHTLRALDPLVVKELKLARHGLKFAVRDLAAVALRAGATPLILGGERYAAARSLAAHAPSDAAAFVLYRGELFALARAVRHSFWDGRPAAETVAHLKPAQRDLFARLAAASANAVLAARFESDTLKAALALDAAEAGHAPHEAGSALALLWSAAQEMCGLQGAVALPRGGLAGLVQALARAAEAAGAQVRTSAGASRLMVSGERLTGVELLSGEQIEAPLVLSGLSRQRTLGDLAPRGLAGLGWTHERSVRSGALGAATLLFGLNRLPTFPGVPLPLRHRFIIAERPETYAAAVSAVRLGHMPDEPVLEVVLPPADPPVEKTPSRLQLSVRVWPVPAGQALDRDALAAKVVPLIDRHVPGFAASLPSCDLLPAADENPASLERLLAGSAERIRTPIEGLLLCGRAAEPVDAVSGRAARQAAHVAVWLHRGVR